MTSYDYIYLNRTSYSGSPNPGEALLSDKLTIFVKALICMLLTGPFRLTIINVKTVTYVILIILCYLY